MQASLCEGMLGRTGGVLRCERPAHSDDQKSPVAAVFRCSLLAAAPDPNSGRGLRTTVYRKRAVVLPLRAHPPVCNAWRREPYGLLADDRGPGGRLRLGRRAAQRGPTARPRRERPRRLAAAAPLAPPSVGSPARRRRRRLPRPP